MPKFILPGGHKGPSVINDRYQFVDGEMTVPSAHVPLLEPILCGYYGCTVELDEVVVEDKEPASTSLDKSVTTNTAPKSTRTAAAAAEQK